MKMDDLAKKTVNSYVGGFITRNEAAEMLSTRCGYSFTSAMAELKKAKEASSESLPAVSNASHRS